jgi:hypothetical protein
MASIDRIQSLISKGPALTAADIGGIEYELAVMPVDEAHEVEPWVWEAVARIVTDPDYRGDGKVPA